MASDVTEGKVMADAVTVTAAVILVGTAAADIPVGIGFNAAAVTSVMATTNDQRVVLGCVQINTYSPDVIGAVMISVTAVTSVTT